MAALQKTSSGLLRGVERVSRVSNKSTERQRQVPNMITRPGRLFPAVFCFFAGCLPQVSNCTASQTAVGIESPARLTKYPLMHHAEGAGLQGRRAIPSRKVSHYRAPPSISKNVFSLREGFFICAVGMHAISADKCVCVCLHLLFIYWLWESISDSTMGESIRSPETAPKQT